VNYSHDEPVVVGLDVRTFEIDENVGSHPTVGHAAICYFLKMLGIFYGGLLIDAVVHNIIADEFVQKAELQIGQCQIRLFIGESHEFQVSFLSPHYFFQRWVGLLTGHD